MAARRQHKVILPQGHGRKKLAFALTPLADAMFQLLIFFMLSTSLAPYSLMTLSPGQSATAESTPAPASAQEGLAPTIWQVSNGRVRVGLIELPTSEVDSMIRDMRQKGSDAVVIFTQSTATVQDIATVLTRLTVAHVGSVQLVSGLGR